MMNKTLLALLLMLVVLLAVSVTRCTQLSDDRDRLSDNQRSLLDDVQHYRTASGHNAASVERLQLTVSEIKRHNAELVAVADDLKIKLKRIQSAATAGITTEHKFTTTLRDSVVIRDSLRIDTVQCLNYLDAWLSFSACTSDGESFGTKVENRDTLVMIAHRVPRKFLFFRWGCKAVRLEVVAKNPYTRIDYAEYIELKK